MGYSRYGLYLELIAGAAVVAVASVLLKGARRESRPARVGWEKAVAFLLVAALAAQAALACVYAYHYEWSMRGTVAQWRAYRSEFKYVLRDRSLAAFLTDEERARYAGVGAWVETGAKSTGLEVLLNPHAPVVALDHWEYFDTRTSRRRYVEAVEGAPGAELFSLCFPEDLAPAKAAIERYGLTVGRVTNVEIPFFSSRDVVGMMLVEIPRPQGPEARRRLEEFGRSRRSPRPTTAPRSPRRTRPP